MEPPKPRAAQGPFACEQCRASKRKCDGLRPACSLCNRLSKPCTYSPEPRTRKRKHWDEEYVRSLEHQVQTLLEVVERLEDGNKRQEAAGPQISGYGYEILDARLPQEPSLPISSELPSDQSPRTANPLSDPDRSQMAMEELSVMMWRTNLGDGATIIQDDHHTHASLTKHSQITSGFDENAYIQSAIPTPVILRYCQDRPFLNRLATVFLDSINKEHHFTQYTSSNFLDGYPYQPIDLTLLHTAILAVGAAFLSAREPTMARASDDFASYAEKFVFDCIRAKPSLAVLRGLCMLSFRSLSLGRDHLGWMFISMAGGLCVHLRLHVLAVDECSGSVRSRTADEDEIRAFWMFYFVDKSAITILGRNCALPWRRVNVPDLTAILAPSGADAETDLAGLSFAWQCRLWYVHDEAMDKICAPTFESLSSSQQVRLLVSTLDQLKAFFRSRPPELNLRPDAPKLVILFHLQYHMAILIMISPFLRISRKSHGSTQFQSDEDSTSADFNSSIALVLHSVTASASESIRLCRIYCDTHSFRAAHPVIAHHLLSASLVHLMNRTSSSPQLRRQSAYWLRIGMELLDHMRVVWPVRAERSITVLRVLARKWGTTGALPIRFSGPIERQPGPPGTLGHNENFGCVVDLELDAWPGQPFNDDYEAELQATHFTHHIPDSAFDAHCAFLELANLADIT